MKKSLLLGLVTIGLLSLPLSCTAWGSSLSDINPKVKLGKIARVLYLNPDIYPEFPQLNEPTNSSFSSAITNQLQIKRGINVKRINTLMPYDSINTELLQALCTNNSADLIIVPHVKYFKVGVGKYVLSNQVVVRLKTYSQQGDFVSEVSYDTYTGNARLLGTAENSVKLGVEGALDKTFEELQKRKMINK